MSKPNLSNSVITAGFLIASSNGVAGNGTTDDTSAINALIQTALTQNKIIVLDKGPYKITGTINAQGDGLVIRRGNQSTAVLQQYTSTIPTVEIGGQDQDLDLNVQYMTQATNTAAVAFQAYKGFKSKYRLRSYGSAKGFALYQGAVSSPHDSVAGNYIFSCVIELMSQSYSISGLDTTPYNADNTGNAWQNVYIQSPVGAPNPTDYGVRIYASDNDVFNQLNIEGGSWLTTEGPLLVQGGNVVINSLHMEGDTLQTYGQPMVNVAGGAALTLNGINLVGCTIEDDYSDPKAMFQLSGNSAVTVNGVQIASTTTISATHFALINASDQTGSFYANGVTAAALTKFTATALNDSGAVPVCRYSTPGSAVINGGTLGATATLALNSSRAQYTGTLGSNCALTISGMTVGCSGTLLFSQDSTGGRTLTVNGTAVSIPTAAMSKFSIQFYSSDGVTLLLVPPAPNITNARTYAVSGAISVPSGATAYLPPFDEPVDGGVSKSLLKVLYSIRGGTSVTFAVTQNGTAIGGLGNLSATPVAASTFPTSATTINDGDQFAVVVSAVTGSPDGLKVTFVFETVQ